MGHNPPLSHLDLPTLPPFAHGKFSADYGALAWSGDNVEQAVDHFHALSHADEAETAARTRGGEQFRVECLAVIGDFEAHAVTDLFQTDAHHVSPRMLGDVDECFLRDTVTVSITMAAATSIMVTK